MKNILFISLILSGLCQAQAFNENNLITASGGYEKHGYIANISYQTYLKSNQFLEFGLLAHFEEMKKNNIKIPVHLYLTNATYNYKLMNLDRDELFSFYGGIGVVGGYEYINRGVKELNNGYLLTPNSKFIMGFCGSLTFRVFLMDIGDINQNSLYLLLRGNYNYLINSDLKSRMPNGTIGIGFRF